MASVLWKERTAEELRAAAAGDAIVVLPIASMEQHGPHLPVGVDTYQIEAVCQAAAERVSGVVVAPALWCGLAEHHMEFGGTFTFDLPTYRAVLLSLLRSIARHGFRRVMIVNGHGGNIAAMNAFLPDFARETGLNLLANTFFHLAEAGIAPLLEDQSACMHACEVETSLMLHIAPHLVREAKLPEAFGLLEENQARLRRGPVTAYRSFKALTASGVVGDARRASRSKGERLFEVCVDTLAKTLSDKSFWL